MPSGSAPLGRRGDPGREHARVGERAVGRDVENADQPPRRIVDVEKLLVGREAEAVRLIEKIVVDQELRRPAGGGHAIDALKAKLMRPFDAVMRRAAIDGIGEIDRAVRADADVVRAVELLALEMRGENLAPSVRPLAHQHDVACSQTIRLRSAS